MKMYLDIQNASKMAGCSTRTLRRIIRRNRMQIIEIRHKFFILGRDFSKWQAEQAKLSQSVESVSVA